VQLGLALGDERAGTSNSLESGARSKYSSSVSMMSWLTSGRERQAGDLSSSGSFSARTRHLAAHVLDVVFQQQNAWRVAAAVGLELVQVEPLQQFLVDPQLDMAMIERRWASSSARVMVAAFSPQR